MVKVLIVLSALKNPEYGYKEASYGINQTNIIIRAEVDPNSRFQRCSPYNKMNVASAIMGKNIGQRVDGMLDITGRIQLGIFLIKEPELINDPTFKRLHNKLEELREGIRLSNILYATYSRSLKNLLKLGYITTHYYETTNPELMYRNVDYLITDKGREYLSRIKK